MDVAYSSTTANVVLVLVLFGFFLKHGMSDNL